MNITNLHTYQEIFQQPKLWIEVFELIHSQRVRVEEFIRDVLEDESADIIFTGAGSSFFIGEMVAGLYQEKLRNTCRAVSTTELVTHTQQYIAPTRRQLVISFARSGNSPESVAAVNFVSEYNRNTKHIFISCNSDGALALREPNPNELLLVLPEKANDKSLAMTSSVTAMALTALIILHLDEYETMSWQIQKLSDLGGHLLETKNADIAQIASLNFERAVFLGSGSMMGSAREAHLKLQELTNGKVICKFDSYLGFRHGPKAVVNERTLMVYFMTNNKYVQDYELDLVNTLRETSGPLYCLAVAEIEGFRADVDRVISFNNDGEPLCEGLWNIAVLLVAQLLAFHKSLQYDLNPDSPSVNGSIHRVVQGVVIYEKTQEKINTAL